MTENLTTTITETERSRIAALLADMHLSKGLGTKEEACSIAAINLALTGELTDEIPDCMSLVTGRWIISVQDAMPDQMRNSTEWKALLPAAAGTGRDHELARRDIILEWIWTRVLPHLQPIADERGFGAAWRKMCETRTPAAAYAAAKAAATAAATQLLAVVATFAAVASANAAVAAAAAYAAYVAIDAAAAERATPDGVADAWLVFDPVGLLAKLISATAIGDDHE